MRTIHRRIVSLIVVVAMALGSVLPAMAAITVDVTITATPTFISLTNSVSSMAIGTVAGSTTYWWKSDGTGAGSAPAEPFVDAGMASTLTNNGSVSEDFDVKVAAFTGGVGWTISLDDTPAEGEISVRAGITGTANEAAMVQVITTDTELVDTLAAAGTKKWIIKVKTPATFTDGVAKSGTVTVTASLAN